MKKFLTPKIGFTFITILIIFDFLSAQVNTEAMKKTDAKEGFSGSTKVGLNYASGNTDMLTLNGLFHLDYKREKSHTFLVFIYKRGEENNSLFRHQAFGHLRVTQSVHPHWDLEIFTQKEFNDFIKLKDRNLMGGGLKILLFKKENHLYFYQGLGFMWENEKYNDKGEGEKNLIRSTNYFTARWTIDNHVQFSFISYYQVDINNLSDYRLLTDLNFDFKISKVLTFETELNYRHDNEPLTNVKHYDISVTNGLLINF